MSETSLSSLILFFIIGFLTLNLLSAATRHVRFLPQIVWVLVLGLAYGFLVTHSSFPLPPLSLSHDLVLLFFVPLLIFGSTQHICFRRLEAVLLPSSLLASLGILISMAVMACFLVFFLQIDWGSALLYGAIISATDPLAIGALLQGQRDIPEQTKLMIEGESILNDGFVVTLFGILTMVIFSDQGFSWLMSLQSLLWHIGGSLLLGIGLGYLGRGLLHWLHEDSFFSRMNTTLALAYGSYFIAELAGTSGILAVFCAALVFSSGMNRQIHHQDLTAHTWEYAEYLANSVLFFLLGASYATIVTPEVVSLSLSLFVIFLAFFGRFLSLLTLWTAVRVSLQSIRFSDFWLLNLSGARGAVSIALILLLPEDFPLRDFFLSCGFVVIVWTLIAYPLLTHLWLSVAKDSKA